MHNRAYRMILILIVITLCTIPLFAIPERLLSARLVFLSEHWSVTYEDQTFEDVTTTDLKKAGMPSLRYGDTITLSRTLPEGLSFDLPSLLIKTRMASLKVFLDGEELFSHDEDSSRNFFAFPEWGSHYVELPSDAAGKTVTIVLTANASRAFSGVYPPVYGTHSDLISYSTYLALLSLLVALFISVYGIFYIAISLFFTSASTDILGQLYAAVLCLLCGIWLLCHYEFFSFVVSDRHALTIGHLMQFLGVPFYYLYLGRMQLPVRRKIYVIIGVLVSVSSLITLFSAFTLKVRFNLETPVYGLFVVLGLFFVIRLLLDLLRDANTDAGAVIQLSGLGILLLSIAVDIVFVFLKDERGLERTVWGRNVISFGVILFLETQLINYFIFVTRRFAEQMEKTELEEMAYRDFLTRLPNRTDAERVFRKMAETPDDFCVVMFDLNDLKEVNDKNGHDAGDRLLSEFAQALTYAFGDGTYLARIGGDEFVAVLEGVTPQKVQRHLRELDSQLRRFDISEPNIAHSVSYGYAFRHECAEEAETDKRRGNRPLQNLQSAAFLSDTEYNFTTNRRRTGDDVIHVKTENIASSESKFPVGSDILQRVLTLADERMYERKRIFRKERAMKEGTL